MQLKEVADRHGKPAYLEMSSVNPVFVLNDYLEANLEKLAGETYPQIRLMTAGAKGWVLATPENNVKFSALLFSFGVPLQKDLNQPLGLMVGAVGGTPSGFFRSCPARRRPAGAGCRQKTAAMTMGLPSTEGRRRSQRRPRRVRPPPRRGRSPVTAGGRRPDWRQPPSGPPGSR